MKLIDFLIRLYPGEFRSRYGREMREFHDARVRDNASLPRVVGDHVQSAFAEHLHAARPDVTYALRGMLRRPGFAAATVGLRAALPHVDGLVPCGTVESLEQLGVRIGRWAEGRRGEGRAHMQMGSEPGAEPALPG